MIVHTDVVGVLSIMLNEYNTLFSAAKFMFMLPQLRILTFIDSRFKDMLKAFELINEF